MELWNDTVSFTTVRETGAKDKYNVAAPVEVTNSYSGCSMQPISVNDKLSNTAYSEATNKCYAPINDFLLSMKSEDLITFMGIEYRVKGIQIYTDTDAGLDHIRFIIKSERG